MLASKGRGFIGEPNEAVDYDAEVGQEDRASVATMEVDVDLFQNVKTKSLHARAKGSPRDGKLAMRAQCARLFAL